MSRPKVNATGANLLDKYMRALERDMPVFQSLEGVVGITLNGGLSRGFGDRLSEIDVTLYLTKEGVRAFSERRQPVATGITMLNGSLYDIKLADYESENVARWEQVALWDASYAKVLYDPQGKIRRMLDDKLANKPKPEDAGGYMFDSWWHFKLAGDIWKLRGDGAQGHMVLTMAIPPLVSALFMLNREFVPHEKWLLHMSRTLEWLPENYESRLEAAMTASGFNARALEERQTAIEALWNDIDAKLNEGEDTPLTFSQIGAYRSLASLIEAGEMELDEFRGRFGADALNSEPFHALTLLTGGKVRVDMDALCAADESALYKWFLEVAREAARRYGA